LPGAEGGARADLAAPALGWAGKPRGTGTGRPDLSTVSVRGDQPSSGPGVGIRIKGGPWPLASGQLPEPLRPRKYSP